MPSRGAWPVWPPLLAVLDAEPEHDADPDVELDVAARRIESEAEAVQIMTIWKAKGLEFPVVCVPTLWRLDNSGRDPLIYTTPEPERGPST